MSESFKTLNYDQGRTYHMSWLHQVHPFWSNPQTFSLIFCQAPLPWTDLLSLPSSIFCSFLLHFLEVSSILTCSFCVYVLGQFFLALFEASFDLSDQEALHFWSRYLDIHFKYDLLSRLCIFCWYDRVFFQSILHILIFKTIPWCLLLRWWLQIR